MNNNKKYASAIQFFSFIIIFATSALTVTHWFFPTIHATFFNAAGVGSAESFDVTQFYVWQKITGFLVDGISTALLIYGFYLLIQLMSYIKENHYFTLRTIALLKRITKVALVYAIYDMVCRSLLTVITTAHNKPGQRMLSLSIGTPDVINVMIFCLIFLCVTIFQHGYEQKREQELTI